ncbi:hypothetical protein BHE74_00016094 [Ensete ventricosum]|nr:hypothetical protein BHE74_00016094 [Ensete ventricosum]
MGRSQTPYSDGITSTSDKNDINLTAVGTPRRPCRTFLSVSCTRYRSYVGTKTCGDSLAEHPLDSSVRVLEEQQAVGWDPSIGGDSCPCGKRRRERQTPGGFTGEATMAGHRLRAAASPLKV